MSDANRSVFSSDVADSRASRPLKAPERPVVTGSGEQLGAHWTLTRQDFVGAPEQAEIDAYGPIVTELTRRAPKNWLGLGANYVSTPRSSRPLAYDRIWADVARQRAADPSFMADVPATNDAEFAKWVRDQEKRKRSAAQGVVRRERGVVQGAVGFGADVVSSFADPINLATLPIGGGGKTILQAAAREALLNAGVETLELPVIAANRAAFGEEMSAGDMLAHVAIAGVAGGVFGGGVKAAGVAGRAMADSATGNAMVAAVPGMSRDRRAARALLRDAGRMAQASDADVARTFAAAIPQAERTPEQQAALAVVERQVEIEATNPFARDRAGMTAHAERLAAAMDALAEGALPAVAVATALDVPRAVSRETPLVRDGAGARDQLKATIGRVENATGNPNARNPKSSATGKYQFVDGTWLRYYKREIGAAGMSDAQILAKRSDGATQDRLMDALLRDNAAGLHRIGAAETAGNLYLAHFAGIGGAGKILKAAVDTPIERVLSAEAIAANPFLRGKTAGDVVAWAHRKMGEAAVPGGERPRLDIAGDDAELRLAQQAIDAATMERAMLSQGGRDVDGVAIDDAAELTPWAAALVEPATVATPVSRETAAMAADVPRESITMPDRAIDPEDRLAVRDYVRDTKGSLKPETVAKALRLDIDRVRDALMSLAADPKVGMRQIGNAFRRNPVQRAPLDLIAFLTRAGGIADNEGHDLVRGMGLQRFVPGAGKLIRVKGGMSLDRARELAAEAGYFLDLNADDAWSNTTVADFLELLDHAKDGGHYSRADLAEAEARDQARARSEAHAEVKARIDARLVEHELEFDRPRQQRAADLVVNDGLTSDEAIVHVINEEFRDMLDAVASEGDSARYADLADDFEAVLAGDDRRGGGSGSEPGADAGDAGQSGARGEEYRGAEADAREEAGLNGPVLPDAAGPSLDDPTGLGAVAIADSLAHDVRAEIDPNIAARQAQEAALRAQSPLKPKVDQDSTIGSPLFDAADQGGFRLDEEGGERTAEDILGEVDADEAAIAAARNCL